MCSSDLPAPANHKDCPLQPKIARGVVQRLSQAQRKATRVIGAKKHKQQNAELLAEDKRRPTLFSTSKVFSLPSSAPVITSSAALNLAIATATGMDVDNDVEAIPGPIQEPLMQQTHSPPGSQLGPLEKKRRTNQLPTTHEY